MSQTAQNIRPKAINWIAILMLITTMRFMVVTFIPSLEMLGGVNANAWLAPWISDTILGLAAPFAAYAALRSTGTRLWGFLVGYNMIGAFDYMHGLAAQWFHPLQNEFNTAEVTYGGLLFSLFVQLVAVGLLFRTDVMDHYKKEEEPEEARFLEALPAG